MTQHTTDITPLALLDPDDLDHLHDTSMGIIEDLGIQVSHERALELLEANGATVDGELVTMDRELVEEAVDQAPSSFTLHGRGEDTDVHVGDGEPLRAPGYGPPNIITHDEGRRSSTLDDYEVLVKLAHEAEPINCTGYNVCEPNDVDQSVKHIEMVERSLRLSDQPLMASTYGEDRAEACLELVGIAVDDPELSKPYAAGLINTVPPRSLDTKMVGGLLTYAEAGQATVISSFTMAGASGPATMAGSLAQANAENLLGITIAQLANPGAPVVYGVPSSNIDMRYGSLSIGSPESMLFVSFAGQMGRYYGVPSRAGGGLTDSKTVDYQAGAESGLVQSATALSGIDFVLHAAGILESYSAISPEKFILDCEVLAYLDRFTDGYPLDEDAFALDVIAETEPADHFLNNRHTLEHAGESFYLPELANKQSHSDWAEAGSQTAFEAAAEAVSARLDGYEMPAMDEATVTALTEAADRHRSAIADAA